MRIWLSTLVVAFIITHFPAALLAEEPATATGNVVDAAGNPVPHATVMVYSAGVKKGYSIFCPTCYRDCGKRSETGVDGNFAIGGLNPDLWFTLLVKNRTPRKGRLKRLSSCGPLSKTSLKLCAGTSWTFTVSR